MKARTWVYEVLPPPTSLMKYLCFLLFSHPLDDLRQCLLDGEESGDDREHFSYNHVALHQLTAVSGLREVLGRARDRSYTSPLRTVISKYRSIFLFYFSVHPPRDSSTT